MVIISTILLISIGVFFMNSQPNKLDSANLKIAETTSQEVPTLSDEIKSVNGQLIDVREPSEYKTSHADGAVNIPLGDILKADYSKIDSKRPIYLICRSGNRAGQAKAALEKAGFANVKNIGGLIDWQKQGDKVCGTASQTCS